MINISKFLPHPGVILSLCMFWGAQHTDGVVNFLLASFALFPLIWGLDRAQPLAQSLYARVIYVALFFTPAVAFYFNILKYKPLGFLSLMTYAIFILMDNKFYSLKVLKENLKKLPLALEVVLVGLLFWGRDLFSYSLLFNETLGYFYHPELFFMSRVLPLAGTSSLVLLMVFMSYGIYRSYQEKKISGLLPLIVLSMVLFILPKNEIKTDTTARVLVMQPNLVLKQYVGSYIKPERKFTQDFFSYWDESLKDVDPNSFDIILAPELGFAYPLTNFQSVEQERGVEDLKKRLLSLNKPLIIGSYYFNAENQKANAYYVLTPNQGEISIDMGSKQQLLPMVEGEDLLKLSKAYQGDSLYDVVGSNEIDFLSTKAVSAICYETTRFWALYEGLNKTRAGLVLNLTDESDYSVKAMANFRERTRYRALETGTTIVRVSKTGYSALIDGQGKTLQHMDLGQKMGIWEVSYEKHHQGTIYGKYHRFYLILTIFYGLFFISLFWARWKKKNPFIV